MRIWDGAFAANEHQRTNTGVVLVIQTANELLLVIPVAVKLNLLSFKLAMQLVHQIVILEDSTVH